MNTAESYLKLALQLAENGGHSTSPNPQVGCVIVKDHKIIGEGWHQGPGTAHAEAMALQQAGATAYGADLYVNLEPCCHFGRTPPCTTAIIEAGIRRIFCSIPDPNPLVNGKGIDILRKAGIEVILDCCKDEAQWLNRFFLHALQFNKPYIIAKWAMSSDGKMIANHCDDSWLTGELSRQHAHCLRNKVDAILVGKNTALIDDPSLTTRYIKTGHAHHPLRIILDSTGTLTPKLRLTSGTLPGTTVIATTNLAKQTWIRSMESNGNQVWVLPKTVFDKVNLTALLRQLNEQQIRSLLVEGGPKTLEAFFSDGLINEVQTYIAPSIISKLARKQHLSPVHSEQLGQDFFLQYKVGP
ncbi:MAG: ribD [Gammaproteobacteria bacterium]|jgi:diaminohydroxyphosphoribosylaminopyrimidine deaminase/5-amino-6-(5-phosphoribosylamino)uracil reductase|nr:ribD [Gammaproteobacteria bacterium]